MSSAEMSPANEKAECPSSYAYVEARFTMGQIKIFSYVLKQRIK